MPTLDWIGKKAVINHHREVPYHLLRCDAKLSVGDPGSGNLLVEADNLLGLKALLPYYAGQVKCVVIDPPYNSGEQTWTYNDHVSSPEMIRWLGENGIESNIPASSVSAMTYYRNKYQVPQGAVPTSRMLTRQVFSLPCHEGMTDDDVRYVVDTVLAFPELTGPR